MKIEKEEVTGVVPVLSTNKRLMVGIFMLLSCGTRREERIIVKANRKFFYAG